MCVVAPKIASPKAASPSPGPASPKSPFSAAAATRLRREAGSPQLTNRLPVTHPRYQQNLLREKMAKLGYLTPGPGSHEIPGQEGFFVAFTTFRSMMGLFLGSI